jgi:uncharacterized delta-60 repeat protein
MKTSTLVTYGGIMKRAFIATMFCGLAVAVFQGTLHAQAGQLDPTFGTGGKVDIVLVNEPDAGNGAVTLQTNGQIVLAGTVVANSFQGALVRYNSNGTLDSSFGTGGVAIDNFTDSFASQNFGVAIQSDGKIVTGGAVYPQGLGVARFNSDGTPDTTFGTGGIATATTNLDPSAGAVLLQPNGKILVAGSGAIARFNTDGSLDTGFGTGGIAALADSAIAMALQKNGEILIGGGETISLYKVNGALDARFGIFGRAGVVTSVAALAVQSNGQIVALGTIAAHLTLSKALPAGAFLVTRYNANGTVDRTFGARGGTLVNFFHSPANAAGMAVVIQPNGDIVAAGQAASGSANGQFAVARLTATGALDPSFGNGGVVTTSFGNIDTAFALALQSNGDIVAAGVDSTKTKGNFVLARYIGQ